jgi:peroxiredoxin Q/BCP
MLKEGDTAPDFSLRCQDGGVHSLSDFKGKKIILYFYPKDDTPGCTKEACNFRDDYIKIKHKNTFIIGISPDSEEDHKKFKQKYNLPFLLLSDPILRVSKMYGSVKSIFGIKLNKIKRTTFILDENRKLIKVFPDVSIDRHSEEILNYL